MNKPLEKLDIDLGFLDKKDSAPVPSSPTAKESADGRKPRAKVTPTVRPWIRYWARYIDIFLFAFIIGFFWGIFSPSTLNPSSTFFTMIVFFVWIFGESVLLSTWGTTPGKWLLNIKLIGVNEKIDFATALNRSFAIWLKGLGAGIPIIYLFTLLSSYRHLTKEGITAWDSDGHFTVTHGKIGIGRMIGLVILLAVSFLLIIIGEI